jgi:RNA polymerase sigma-70 factor (ECF subfamily)
MRAPSPETTAADLELLNRIAKRDADAVAGLYDRHARVLYGLIHRILRDDGDAEDVLQEVFLRVWDKAETYDVALGSPMAWLVRIARNRAIDQLRSRQARPATQPEPAALASAAVDEQITPGPERAAALSEEQRAIAHALNLLATEQRVLIEDAFFLGLTHSELAAKFNLPLGTVKTRIRTGMIAMRDHLQHL